MRARVRRLLDKKLPNSLERGSDPRAQQQAGGGDVNAAREYVVRTRSQSHSLAPSSRRLVDELMNDPKRKPTSHASFGLSPHALKSMLDVPTRLTELGACVLPERAASLKASADAACDRLVAARTVRALVELMQRFIISIDTGCKSLVTLVCGILVPLSGWRQRFFGKYDDDDALPEESVLQFFDSGIVYHYIVHRVEARSLHPPAPAPAASTTPTSTATARATSLADYDEFATPFLANFSDNVSDFCVGSMCAERVLRVQHAANVDHEREAHSRDKAVFRRRRKMRAAVRVAIDVAIERFYARFGTTPDGRRLPGRGEARVRRTIVCIGRPTFGNARGHAPSPAKRFVQSLKEAGYTVFECNEYLTSQRCDVCGSELQRTRGHSFRFWRCEHDCGSDTSAAARDSKHRHKAEQVRCVALVCIVCVCV